jgi:sensor domain CHASE-containing protein
MAILLSFVLNLLYAVIGFGVLLIASVYLDRRISKMKGGHFRMVIDRIHESAISTAIYYGLRFAGLCLLASAFVRG